ncbi:glycosyltransferase family 25 protein [Helicobacter sp. 11S02596-1]|uniref:glycosyltransferase family 25 protein n=1 Tax=Helicobacter sp. 11S02596-1 TaxID=1476194 RepID=UPI000BA5B996|nr:glycosyltransferase family 25 protein [Helicobacter sp. 11S02596-1]PAF43940.1 hypothetical protein BJI48_03895 [Helicobacter sp. 11S02596-1]
MRIFIISLKNALARRENILNQIASLGENPAFEFHIFDAIDGREEDREGGREFEKNPMPSEYCPPPSQKTIISKYYCAFLAKLYRGRELSPCELGCFASHFLLWEKCVQINESIIVLEDDIEILPNFFDALTHIAKNRFEYVRLMQLSTAKSCQLDEHFGFLKHYAFGTQGYYLTPKGAQKFLRYAKKWVEPVDDYVDRYWKHHNYNVIYFPHPIRQNFHALESTIGDRDSTLNKNLLLKTSRGIRKRYQKLVKYFYDSFVLSWRF